MPRVLVLEDVAVVREVATIRREPDRDPHALPRPHQHRVTGPGLDDPGGDGLPRSRRCVVLPRTFDHGERLAVEVHRMRQRGGVDDVPELGRPELDGLLLAGDSSLPLRAVDPVGGLAGGEHELARRVGVHRRFRVDIDTPPSAPGAVPGSAGVSATTNVAAT